MTWMTQKEAAAYSGMHRKTLYRAVKAGVLKVGRPRTAKLTLGRALRFRTDWLDAWLESA